MNMPRSVSIQHLTIPWYDDKTVRLCNVYNDRATPTYKHTTWINMYDLENVVEPNYVPYCRLKALPHYIWTGELVEVWNWRMAQDAFDMATKVTTVTPEGLIRRTKERALVNALWALCYANSWCVESGQSQVQG